MTPLSRMRRGLRRMLDSVRGNGDRQSVGECADGLDPSIVDSPLDVLSSTGDSSEQIHTFFLHNIKNINNQKRL